MRRARVFLAAGLIIVSCLAAPPAMPGLRGAESLPESLTNEAFWALSSTLSEPNGWFRSDNLLSNEIGFPFLMDDLVKAAPAGRVYLGVGPEQNFNYIAALEPRMAFIIDIRRGNLDLHLMYKALFEIAADRAEFVSLLFAKPRPATLNELSTPEQIFQALGAVQKSATIKDETLKAIRADLVDTHHFPLDSQDLAGVESVYSAFYTFGSEIRYSSTQGGGFGGYNQPSYAELMTVTDHQGKPRSFLASEQSFRLLKALEAKNLVVPVVGNFGGPKAVRAAGRYLRDHGGIVSAFYLSNVEMYLGQQNLLSDFCRNAGTLPMDTRSTFIRSSRGGGGGYGRGVGLNLSLGNMAAEAQACQ